MTTVGSAMGPGMRKESVSQPDRTSLPIRREAFAGVVNRTLAGSQPDWNLIGHPTAPEGAPNVLLVLIDDAGFGNPGTFGGPIQTPNYSRMAEAGLRYNRFHVTALCSPTRAALLTGRNNHAVGYGSIGEFAGGFPGYSATLPTGLRAAAADPAGQRLQHGGIRQVASDAGRSAGPRRAVRPLAERLGVRLLLRDPRRGGEPVGSLPGREPEDHRDARGVLRRGRSLLLPRRDGRSDHRVAPWSARAGRRKPFFVYYSTGCSHAPHHVAKEWADKYKGSSTRAGTGSARRPSPGRRSSA